jgi:glycosyltransferase involved in cell wall biosynthesis
MKRILHILGGLNRGGIETWLIHVLRRIDRQRFQFDFVVHSDGPFQYQAEVESLGSKVLVCRGFRNPLIYGSNLLGILRRYGPYDCLHSHMHHFSGIPLLIARMTGIPIRVVHSHLDTSMLDQDAPFSRRSYTGAMKRLIWSCCTTGTAVSTKAADALFPPRWRNDRRWQVMLLGIELERFRGRVNGNALRRELGIPDGATVIGHAGRFERQKNHAFALEIAAECIRQGPEMMLLLVGDGPLRPEIERKAHSMGLSNHVRFAGVRSDVPALMRGVMDVFLLPSIYEGLPIVLLEAQAAGLFSLISDVIAEESDFVRQLVSRESLSTPPMIWAAQLRELAAKSRAHQFTGIPEKFSIDASVERLMHCYANDGAAVSTESSIA